MNDFIARLQKNWGATKELESRLIKEHGNTIFKADSTDDQFAHMTCGNYVVSIELSSLADCEGQAISKMRLDIMKITEK
jgi:hypothetical protein